MPEISPEARRRRGHLASLHARADRVPVEAIADARRDYAAQVLEDHIRRVVDAAPPLTPEQRDRLALLLRPTAGGAAA